ncbi:MAG TPA: hypothetical protein VMM58_12565 [Bacteroidota bacterium]|nr:hypothetical protein [Bacteroidota bacterium]
MTELGFSHKNAVQAILKEIAQQTENLTGLLLFPESPHRILPVNPVHDEADRDRLLKALSKVRSDIEEMCREFNIKFPPLPLQQQLTNMADYLYAVALNLRPEQLLGYGELTEGEQDKIKSHLARILNDLEEI